MTVGSAAGTATACMTLIVSENNSYGFAYNLENIAKYVTDSQDGRVHQDLYYADATVEGRDDNDADCRKVRRDEVMANAVHDKSEMARIICRRDKGRG